MVRYFLNNNSAVCKVQIHVRVLYKSKFVVKFCQMMLLGCIYVSITTVIFLICLVGQYFYWNLFALIFYRLSTYATGKSLPNKLSRFILSVNKFSMIWNFLCYRYQFLILVNATMLDF